jgi:hypothetical protein
MSETLQIGQLSKDVNWQVDWQKPVKRIPPVKHEYHRGTMFKAGCGCVPRPLQLDEGYAPAHK